MEEISPTSEKKKKGRPPYRTFPLLCRVCEANVFPENKGYYSAYYSLLSAKAKELNIFARIKGLFGIEDDNESDGSYVVCKTCIIKVKRYEATFKELISIRDVYQNNVARWKNEAQSKRTKLCSSLTLPASIDEERSTFLSPCADGEKPSMASTIRRNSKKSLDEITVSGNQEGNPLQRQMSDGTVSCFQTAEARTTLHRKKRGRPPQLSLLCRVCETTVLGFQGYYCGYYNLFSAKSKGQNLFARITGLFGDGDDDKSLGPHIVCKKCLRKVERYESTFKELVSLREAYQNSLARWRNRNQSSQRSPPSSASSRSNNTSTEMVLNSKVKLSASEKSTVSSKQAATVLENENIKQSIDLAKVQKGKLGMASASPSTDQTQKATSTECHLSTGGSHVTATINSSSQTSTTAFPINVPYSLENANLQPKALVFPSGTAFDYENFPKIVSICWPVITDLSGNKVIARDGPTRESVSNNDAVVSSSCLDGRASVSSFRWDKPQNEPSSPFTKAPLGTSCKGSELQNDNTTSNINGVPRNVSKHFRIPSLAQPCEYPIHTKSMCKRLRLQHVEISAQILLSDNLANYNSNDDATVPVMKNPSRPFESNSNHVASCLPHYVTGSLSQTREKEPVFGQVLVSPDAKHPDSNPAVIRKILPVKQPVRVKPLHVSFCLPSDPKAGVGDSPTATDQEKKEVPCPINRSDKQTSNAEAPRNNEIQRSIEESELTVMEPSRIFKCMRAVDDATIETSDGPRDVTDAKTLKLSDQSIVFFSPPEDVLQFTGSGHQSTRSAVQSAGITQQILEFSNKQENVRELIARIRYIKSKLHRAECEQRKKQMLKNILILQKRVKALTKGMRKEKVDLAKIQEQTGDTANKDKTISTQELPEVGGVQLNPNGTDMETQVRPIVSDETETGNEERESVKKDAPFLPYSHQVSKVATQEKHQNGEESLIPSVDNLTTANEAGTNETHDTGELESSPFCGANDAESKETGGSNVGKDRDSDDTRKECIVTLPVGIGLASSSGTWRKRSLPSSNDDEYRFQGGEDGVSKKMKRLSLPDNEVPEDFGSVQGVSHDSKNVTEDGTSERLVPVDKDYIRSEVKHDKTKVTENEMGLLPVKDEGERSGAHSCRFHDVAHDFQGVMQTGASESLLFNGNSEMNDCSKDFENSSQREIVNLTIKKETDSYAFASCNLNDTSVEQDDSAGILAETSALIVNGINKEENCTEQKTKNAIKEDQLGGTSCLPLGFESFSHDAQSVSQDAENGKSLKVAATNATPTKSQYQQRETRLTPRHFKDTQIVRKEENIPPSGSVQARETPDAMNINEIGPSRLVLVDLLLNEGVGGKVYESCQSAEQGPAAARGVSSFSGSINNRIEDVETEGDQSRFTQETQSISPINDCSAPLERNDNVQELSRFSLQSVVKEEGAQGFTSPSLNNTDESQEDIDFIQSLQIRQARILNLTEKRDRLLNLAGLRINRL